MQCEFRPFRGQIQHRFDDRSVAGRGSLNACSGAAFVTSRALPIPPASASDDRTSIRPA